MLPRGVAVDTNHLYWANGFGHTIVRADLDGGNSQVIASGQGDPDGLSFFHRRGRVLGRAG